MSDESGRRARGTTAVWVGLIVLALLGVFAGAYRALFISEAGLLSEPVRQSTFARLGIVDPLQAQRWVEIGHFDAKYGAHPFATLMHVVPGALLLGLAPLQLAKRIRDRHRRLHRWLGRVLVALSIFIGTSALFFGLLMPFAGLSESIGITLVTIWFLIAIARAFIAIRRGDVATHREWMIRAMSVAYAISTVRLIAIVADLTLTPHAIESQDVFLISIWSGWIAMIAGAEWWIRYTRRLTASTSGIGLSGGAVAISRLKRSVAPS